MSGPTSCRPHSRVSEGRVQGGGAGLGSDPESRSPVDFGFDEAVWSPRTADEVLLTMKSYFLARGGVVISIWFDQADAGNFRSRVIYERPGG
jgi:hypothetical protein